MSALRSRLAAAVVAAAAAFAAGCAQHEPPAPPPRPVQLMQVRAGGAAATTVFAGEVRPRYESDLGFRIGGKVVARSVDVGARVERGQVLARLDPADVQLQADAQRAAAAAAATEYRFAQSEFDRYQNLYRQKFVSESALDQKRNALDVARAKHNQAQAQLAVTRNQAGYATLVAPDRGVITAVSVEAGQVVAAGQTVMRLAREEEREVAISVPEGRIGELGSAGAIAVVLWAHPRKLYPARVREVAPAVDPVTRTFAVRVSVLEPDAALQWGMTANVVLQGDDAPGAVLLPLTSVYRSDGTPAVWVFDPQTGTVRLRAVELAQYREDGVVVRAGLEPGEWVVTAGVHKLRDGEVVRPFEPGGGLAGSTPAAQTRPAAPPAPTADGRRS
jgi:RND family efflux transporter MFP subunit